MKSYDLIIIGAGAAGLTAAIYASRYKLKVLVIGKLIGGTTGEAYMVCNFPSYGRISGTELIQKIINQVRGLGVEIKPGEVYSINTKNKKNKEVFHLSKSQKSGISVPQTQEMFEAGRFEDKKFFVSKTPGTQGVSDKNRNEFEVIISKEKYLSKKIIIATGLTKNKLKIEREKELIGRGINYCATCDAPLYKNKIVVVVGGSDSALTSALLLAEFAKKIYISYRKDKFINAEPTWKEEVMKNKKISIMFNSEVKELIGKDFLEGIKIKRDSKIQELKIDGLFIEIGSTPNDFLAKELKLKMDGAYIKVDKKQKTSVSGVFAAGDITNNPLKQIVTACAEGAIAAYSAYKEISAG